MKITDFLDPRAITLKLESTDKEGVLHEMVNLLAQVKDLGDRKSVVKSLLDRENLGSTGIGQGIAIPHGKTDRVKELCACLGISQKGVNFDSLDGEPVYIFFLLVAPKDSAGPHLKALARVSRLLRDGYFCQLLRNAKSDKDVYQMIVTEEEKKP
ncbi:MAG: PTS sugar transporter subunit IIA [Candidatus Omnitrophica bacterium]|nr:PTS sugar transporter subunit IIA [Candidatus Omnitrophota bacterium]